MSIHKNTLPLSIDRRSGDKNRLVCSRLDAKRYKTTGGWLLMAQVKYLFFLLLFLFFALTAPAFSAQKRIAVVVAKSTDGDAYSLGDSWARGVDALKARFKKKISADLYVTYQTDEDLRSTLKKAAEKSDLVILPDAAYYKFLPEIAEEYPSVAFVVFGEIDAPGVRRVLFREEEGGFLAGALAAMMTEYEGGYRINAERKIAAILGEEDASAKALLKGYVAGAWYIDPEVKVLSGYTKSFDDMSMARDLALNFSAQGADVIFVAARSAGDGAISEAAESGYWVIGSYTEQEELYPDAVLSSVVTRVESVLYYIVGRYIEDGLRESEISLGVADGCIDISVRSRSAEANVPQDVREKIEEIRDKISRKLIIIR